MRRLFVCAALMPMMAAPASAGARLERGMVVRFTRGTLACLSKESLLRVAVSGLENEDAEVRGMMVENGGDCLMVSPSKRVRVVSVEYDDPDVDIGLVEFVGEGAASASGAWAFSMGAEEVKAPQGKRHVKGRSG